MQQRKRVGRPLTTDDGKRNVREHFLDTALELFGTQGVSSTSVACIAARVGVTPAMAHYYFSSRKKLLDVLAEERLMPMIDAAWKKFQDGVSQEKPFVDCVALLIDGLVHLAEDMPFLPSLWLNEFIREGGQFRERILPHIFSEHVSLFFNAYSVAESRGEVRGGLNPKMILFSILGSTFLPLAVPEFTGEKSPGGRIDREEVGTHAKSFLLPGLRVETP